MIHALDPQALAAKASYLGHMIHRLLLVHIGMRDPDDRDDFKNKRVDAPGQLMSLLRICLKSVHVCKVKKSVSTSRPSRVPMLSKSRHRPAPGQ